MKRFVAPLRIRRRWIPAVLTAAFVLGSLPSKASADPPLPLPRIPICGDQDGSEVPLVFRCPDLVHTPDVQSYLVPGSGAANLLFDFVFREALFNNELGFIAVDSPTGDINGLQPGDPGYLAAAFQGARILFPSGSNAFTPDTSVELNGGDILVFFIIQNNTLANFLANNPDNELNKHPLAFFSLDALNPDGVDHFAGFESAAEEFTQFGFEDLTDGGDLDYDDVVYNVVPPLEPLTPVDLTVNDVVPIQVVERPDVNADGRIDLVLDKPMVVRIDVGVIGIDELPADQVVEVQLRFQGIVLRQTGRIDDLASQFTDFFLTPGSVGDDTITIEVDPGNEVAEGNETNNETSLPVTVKDTRDLYLVHLPLAHIGTLTESEYADTVTNGSEFLLGVYPLAPGEFIKQKVDVYVPSLASFIPEVGLLEDFVRTWLQGELWSLGKADRSVGVVTADFFELHTGCTGVGGVALPPIPAVFVLEGQWTAAAHEIGHTFDLEHEYIVEVTDGCAVDIIKAGDPATGYWVERREPKDTLGFMGTSPGTHSFDRWAEHTRFIQLFDQFRIGEDDPTVLLVSGLVDVEGQVDLQPLYRIKEAPAQEIPSGDHTLELLDARGQQVDEISFQVADELIVDPLGSFAIDSEAFALSVPYSENVHMLRILEDGEVLVEVVITSQLLHDAVDAIPDFGFEKNPEQRRKALHNKIDALELQIEAGAFSGAVNKLEHDIKPALERWLVDDYSPENILQYSKREILELMNEMIQRLALAD